MKRLLILTLPLIIALFIGWGDWGGGGGSGDMTKAVYDKNDDGFVDSAAAPAPASMLWNRESTDVYWSESIPEVRSDISESIAAHPGGTMTHDQVIDTLNAALVGITQNWYFGDSIWAYNATTNDTVLAIWVDADGKLHYGPEGTLEADSAQLGGGAVLKKWIQVGSYMAFIENDDDTTVGIPVADTTELGGGSSILTTDKTTADSSLTTATLTDSELSFSVTSGTYYHFAFYPVFVNTGGSGTGVKVSVTCPSTTIFTARATIGGHGGDGTDNGWMGDITSSGDSVTSTTWVSSGVQYQTVVEGTILPSENGTLMLQFATEDGAQTITMKQGSHGFLYTLP